MQIARKPRRRNNIVLTSLVDVLFVLLFFFMLVTNNGDWRAWSMSLSGGISAKGGEAGTLTVQMRGDGRFLIDGESASLETIRGRLSAPGARAVLVAGSGVSLQSLIDVLDRLKPTGASLTLGRAAP